MKITVLFLSVLMLLSGCSAAETFETIGPVQHLQGTSPEMAAVTLALPETAVAQTFGGEETVYECDGYTILLQTLSSGNLTATVQSLSGFSPEQLTVIKTGGDDLKRYDWVWTAAGEEGDILGRASILDDGDYHYCLCVFTLANQSAKLSEEWNDLFSSFRLQR